MPSLDWIGKKAVIRHHKEVPFRLLEPIPELSCGAASGNLLVQGDNLRQKSTIRSVLEQKFAEIRQMSLEKSYQHALFSPSAREKFFVDQSYVFEFTREYYPTSCYNAKRWGHYEFKKHFYRQIGDFDSKEEFECACFLDNEAVKGNIKFWIRNLANRGFYLQKAFSRFYPDFICVLPDDRILVVEYKGADRWDTPKVVEDRKIGALWAELSDGLCIFVMTKDQAWSQIIAAASSSTACFTKSAFLD